VRDSEGLVGVGIVLRVKGRGNKMASEEAWEVEMRRQTGYKNPNPQHAAENIDPKGSHGTICVIFIHYKGYRLRYFPTANQFRRGSRGDP